MDFFAFISVLPVVQYMHNISKLAEDNRIYRKHLEFTPMHHCEKVKGYEHLHTLPLILGLFFVYFLLYLHITGREVGMKKSG